MTRTVLSEFQKRRGFLSNIRFGEEKGRLADISVWMEKQSEINQILESLRGINVDSLFSPHGFRPKVQSQDDICAIGLYFLERAKAGVSLHTTAIKIGVRPSYGTSSGQAYVDEVMASYVNPLFDHVESALENIGVIISVEDNVQMRLGLLEIEDFGKAFPESFVALRKIAEYCGQTEEAGSWFHVATSCRELLATFTRELQTNGTIVPAPELKQGDTKGILKQLVKERSSTMNNLIELIQAIWTYVQSNVHRQSATKQDALRVYLWTSLLISEIWLIIRHDCADQIVPQSGIHI